MTAAAEPAPVPGPAPRAAHLLALSAFAVAQPLLGLLRDNATFFVAKDFGSAGVVGFVAALLVLPPLLLWLLEAAVGLGSRAAQTWLHRLLVALLVALLVLPPVHRALGGVAAPVAAAAAIAALGAAVYAGSVGVQSFLTFLGAAPPVFAAYFLLGGQIRPLLSPAQPFPLVSGPPSRTPVVVLLLDELSTSSLMKADGTIDERMFPSFARLAAGSTWYRNATSVLPMTEYVVPILLTGRYFEPGVRVPTVEAYPDNLFHLLASSHRLVVWESVTALCPPRLCDDLEDPPPLAERIRAAALDVALLYAHVVAPQPVAADLPPVNQGWGGFWSQFPQGHDRKLTGPARRAADGMRRRDHNSERSKATTPFAAFERFLDAIDGGAPPSLYFLHLLLPHVPWTALPTGTSYEPPERPDGQDGVMKTWTTEEWPTDLAFQRYMLQLGYVDVLLGHLLERLVATGLYEPALLVVLADHGVTFRPGADYRQPNDDSVGDLMYTPLFVKSPFQSDGAVSDRNVESLDVLPTIAAALGIDNPFPSDGTSALDAAAPERPTKTMHAGGKTWTVDGKPPAEWPGLARKRRLFGDAGSWRDVERMASRPGLVGRTVADVGTGEPVASSWSIDAPERFARVDPASGVVPAYVRGEVRAPGALPADVAVAVDGTVWAVGRTFAAKNDGSARFAVLLPEEALRAGRNDVEALLVADDGRLRRLPPAR